jgi:hypothetical protein
VPLMDVVVDQTATPLPLICSKWVYRVFRYTFSMA